MGKSQPYACALRTERWEFLRSAEGQAMLHDLAGGGEALDVASNQAEVSEALRRLLDKTLATSVLGKLAEEELDPEAEALLEGLGYAGDDD